MNLGCNPTLTAKDQELLRPLIREQSSKQASEVLSQFWTIMNTVKNT